MTLHVSTRHIDQSKNVPKYRNSSRKKSSCWFPTDLNNNVDQIGSSSPGCRDWFFWCLKPPRIPRHDTLTIMTPRTSAASPALFTYAGFLGFSFNYFQNLTKTSRFKWLKKKSRPALRLGDLSVVPFSRPPASRRACPGQFALMAWSASKLQVNGPKNAQMGLGIMNFPKNPSKCGGLLSKKNWGCQIESFCSYISWLQLLLGFIHRFFTF